MAAAARIRVALSKPLLPALFFFGGVTFDSLTLNRIDNWLDNAFMLAYLVVLGALIVLTARADMGKAGHGIGSQAPAASLAPSQLERGSAETSPLRQPLALAFLSRTRPYYVHAIQFLLGGLFSAYTIFYSQSASLTSQALFFALLIGLLVGNEFLHHRLSNLRLLVSLYALVVLSFFTFFLPVLTGFMNTFMFLLGAVLSAAVIVAVVRLVYRNAPGGWAREGAMTMLPAFGLIGLLVGFYFLNWIPPVPLSMKSGGIYHQIAKADGAYRLTYEAGEWYEFWKRSDNPFRGEGPAVCFTSVFAPVSLRTTIYHRWQYRPDGGHFSMTDRIGYQISGGREGGYRAYTVKQHLLPGDWRVDVETEDGRIIGRVKFRVEPTPASPPEFETVTY